LIGPLADNGGGILTHALLSNSRAVDAGHNEYAIDRLGQPLTMDIRGYDRIVNKTVDMGSYEYNSQPVALISTITGRVTALGGRGLSGARVLLRSANGEIRYAMTNPFGYYRFASVPTGFLYGVDCTRKGMSLQTYNLLTEELSEQIDFSLNW